DVIVGENMAGFVEHRAAAGPFGCSFQNQEFALGRFGRDMHDAAVGFVIDDDVGSLLGGEFVKAGAKGGGRRPEVRGQRSRGRTAGRRQRRRRRLDRAQQRAAFLGRSLALGGRLVPGGGGQSADGGGDEAEEGCA